MSDFEEQLKQEELAKLAGESADWRGQGQYTDADGTVYEWDADKRAWFPKIDADFIAQYQMNYGVDQSTPVETIEGETTEGDDASQQYTKEEYEKYCQDYYNNYYYHEQSGEQEKAVYDKREWRSSDRAHPEEDKNSDYYHYFSQYYDEHYVPSAEENAVVAQTESTQSGETKPKKVQENKAGEKRKPEPEAGWVVIDEEKNTNVYVSGLPLDITDEEFSEFMSKCGLIMPDALTKGLKMKLYRDSNGEPKGDARCCYIKVESVNLALQILDGSDLRGHTVHVERAKFTMKGNFDPSKKRKKLSSKEKKKLKLQQEKLFDWKPDNIEEVRMRWEKVVVLKQMFSPAEFEEDPMLINELRDEVRDECAKFGDVKKVVLYDHHPDGVMTVHFKEAEFSDACVEALNGRWFAKKQISAETWDGKTKYEVEESAAEREDRLTKWAKFLESSEEASKSTASCSTETSARTESTGTNESKMTESSASGVDSDQKILPNNPDSVDRNVEVNSESSAASEASVLSVD